MKSGVQSTRQWQRLLLSCSVLLSTAIAGGQAAVAAESIAAESIAAESIAAESTDKSSIRAIAPESTHSALSPISAQESPEVELAEVETAKIEAAAIETAAIETAAIEGSTGTAADLEPMLTNPAIANTDVSPDLNPNDLNTDLLDSGFLAPAPLEIAQTGPREVRYVFSYIGLGVNLGIAGDAAIGDTSFAVLSKIALNPYLSLRPSLLIEDDVSFLVPITYDFGIAGPGSGIAPFAGLGLTFSTGDDNNVDFLLTGGLDFPINDSLVATASANLAPFGDEVDFGILLGLGYTFNARRAVVRRPTIADVQDAVGGTADALGRRSRINPSFIGAGANLGIGGDSALGNTSFAILSKFALGRTLSIRPGLLIEDDVEVLLPVTFDVEPIRTGYATLAPYVGAGLAFSFGDDSEVDLLVTGGVDIPLTSSLALTTGINFGLFDSFDVGATLGLVYTFSPY